MSAAAGRDGGGGPGGHDGRDGPRALGPGGEHAAAVAVLRAWSAPTPRQEELRRAYLEHLAAHADGVWRGGPPEHLTASCVVLDERVRHVLLTLHRKGGFWVQPGGHCEPGDGSPAGTALREAREECGIADLRLEPEPAQLDRHDLTAAFGRCRRHLDVTYVATCPRDAAPAVSTESLDVAWWPLDALPAGIVPDLPDRLAELAAARRG